MNRGGRERPGEVGRLGWAGWSGWAKAQGGRGFLSPLLFLFLFVLFLKLFSFYRKSMEIFGLPKGFYKMWDLAT